PPAPRDPHDELGELAQLHVAVAEDVALARPPPLGREHLAAADAVGEHDAEAPGGERRQELADAATATPEREEGRLATAPPLRAQPGTTPVTPSIVPPGGRQML